MTSTAESVRTVTRKSLERVFAHAYRSAGQSNLAGNAWTKIALNAVVKDLGANFDITTNNRFNIPVTGLYDIIGSVEFTSVIADKRYLVAIYKNGAAIRQGSGQAALAANVTANVHHIVFLEENDYIELYAQPEVGGGVDTVDVSSGADTTVLIVRLITKEGIRQ